MASYHFAEHHQIATKLYMWFHRFLLRLRFVSDWLLPLAFATLLLFTLMKVFYSQRKQTRIPTVLSTALSSEHTFTKQAVPYITLKAGLGVEGDCHSGTTVQHRSRLHIKPPPANLRQVHLINNEILMENNLRPAEIGENITTSGVDLLKLGKGTKLHFANPEHDEGDIVDQDHAVVTVTGLRNPCPQIEKHRSGLQERFITRNADRLIIARKAGIMSVVDVGGVVSAGMKIIVQRLEKHEALEPI